MVLMETLDTINNGADSPLKQADGSTPNPPSVLEIANEVGQYILWVKDRGPGEESLFEFANSAFLNKFGYTAAEIREHSLKEVMNPYHYNILRERFRRNPRDVTPPFPIIAGLKNRQGQWVEIEIFPSYIHSSKVFSVFLFCCDIERRIRHANIYYQLYDNAIDGIFCLGKDGRIKNGNTKIQELTGHRAGKLNEDMFKRFMPEETARGAIAFLKRCLEGDDSESRYEIQFSSPYGIKKTFVLSTIKNPVSDFEIIVNIRDVTAIKMLENEMRESEEKYRSLVEQLNDVIFVMQGEKIIFANSAANQFMESLNEDPDTGLQDFAGMIIPEDRSSVREFFKKSIRGIDRNRVIQFSIAIKIGELMHMELTSDLINYQGQKAIIGVLRDITQNKRLEQKINETEKLGTIAQFAASVAHEIRNPLEGLTSAGLLLSRDLQVQGANKQLLDVIIDTTNEINKVVNQFVSLTHKTQYYFTDLDTRKLVNDSLIVVEKCKDSGPAVKIVKSFQRNLGHICGDFEQLQKTLIHIISNACQAVRGEGTIRIRAENSIHNAKPAVTILIRDTGEGIPANILPQIWEPFITSKKKGMGMGLFITRRIVEDHGGMISIRKTNKKGTTFQIVIPAF
jgi:two-component system sporulation sensor kinase A